MLSYRVSTCIYNPFCLFHRIMFSVCFQKLSKNLAALIPFLILSFCLTWSIPSQSKIRKRTRSFIYHSPLIASQDLVPETSSNIIIELIFWLIEIWVLQVLSHLTFSSQLEIIIINNKLMLATGNINQTIYC